MIAVKLTHKESDMAGGLTEAEMTVQEDTAHCAVSTSEVDNFFFFNTCACSNLFEKPAISRQKL